MNSIENFKKGDTFTLTCTYKIDNVAISIDDITIESQIRTARNVLIQELTVTKLEETGKFTMTATAEETQLWPVAVLKCDIQLSEGGSIRSTNTFDVKVINSVTQ